MMKDKQNTMDNNSQFTTHNSPLIKKGYKNTEIGVIPVEWGVSTLDEISTLISSKRIFESEYVKSGIPFYRGKEISMLIENKEIKDILFISKERYEKIKKEFGVPVKGDILITAVGTLGNSYLISNDEKFYFKDGNLIWLKNIKNIDNKYLNIQIANYKDVIVSNAIGSSQKALTIVVLKNTKIPLPPLPEQTAIATVLSDTDKLLQALQKKIAKKQAIKKGAMQELLKPKEGWVVKPLGKFVNFSNGKAHENHIDANGEFVVINSKFVSTGGRVFKRATANFSPLKKGDIVMVMSDIPNGKALAKCFLVPKDNKYALNQRICSIRTEEADTKFLLYILNRNKYYLAFDSGTGQTNLKKEDVLNCPIPLPPTKEEQTKIATILSDMNIEIEALEKQLAKYKQVKQGLMQNLLTGKIRLISG